MSVHLTDARASYQAVFALDVVTAAGALLFLALASRPTFVRIKKRKFSTGDASGGTPLKTTLGTYLFLWPALFCLFVAYVFQFVADILKTNGTVRYDGDLGLGGRRPYAGVSGSYDHSIAVLSFATALASILFTLLVNGGVWIYSSHILNNGTRIASPNVKSRIWNTIILLAIAGTGLAAWGHGLAVRRGDMMTYSQVLSNDRVTRIIYIVYSCVVVSASFSVSIQTTRTYTTMRANCGKDVSERPQLARFALVVVPLLWLRNFLIIYDIVLLYVDTTGWSTPARLASLFLLIIFGQITNLAILGMVLWSAWRTGRTVRIFGKSANGEM